MITKAEIGAKIRRLRTEEGLSQEELGHVLGKSHAAISDIERGKTDLSVLDLLLIANHLNTSPTFILNIQSSPENVVLEYKTIKSKEADSKGTLIRIFSEQPLSLE